MISTTTQIDLNHQLARAINQDARNNPNSPYRGKFVGIAHGKVVAVADSLDDLGPLLERAEPNRRDRLSIEASADYEGPHEILDELIDAAS